MFASVWKLHFSVFPPSPPRPYQEAATFLCHTLFPNVTVDFTRREGNAISFMWEGPRFGHHVPSWRLYVHDRHEQVWGGKKS